MRLLSIILLSLLIVSGCKKKENDDAKPVPYQPKDFELIPVKDAEWEIHCKGWHDNDTIGPIEEIPNRVDSAVHSDFIITATGQSTLVSGKRFYKYNLIESYSYSLAIPLSINLPFSKKKELFLREDSIAQIVYLLVDSLAAYDYIIVNLMDEEVGKKFGGHPEMEIKYVDSLIVAGSYIKRWQACNSYDKSIEILYKAYGVGARFGIMPSNYTNSGSKVKNIVFTYKGSTLRFDLPDY